MTETKRASSGCSEVAHSVRVDMETAEFQGAFHADGTFCPDETRRAVERRARHERLRPTLDGRVTALVGMRMRPYETDEGRRWLLEARFDRGWRTVSGILDEPRALGFAEDIWEAAP